MVWPSGQLCNYVVLVWHGQAAIYYILIRCWFYHGKAKRPLMAFLFTGILSLFYYFSGNNKAVAPQYYQPSISHICEEAWYYIISPLNGISDHNTCRIVF